MKLCASAFGESFRYLFKEIPIQWQPFVFLTLVLLASLMILTHAGLEIWTPLIRLGFRPRRNENILALENEIRQLRHDNDRLKLELDKRPALPAPPVAQTQGVQAVEEVGSVRNIDPVLPGQNFVGSPSVNQRANSPASAIDNPPHLSRDQNAQEGRNVVIAQAVEDLGGRNNTTRAPLPIQEAPGKDVLPDVMVHSESSGVLVDHFHSLPSSTEEIASVNTSLLEATNSLLEVVDPSASNNTVGDDARSNNAQNQAISSQTEHQEEQFEIVDPIQNIEEPLGANAANLVNDRALNTGQVEGRSEAHQQQRVPVETSDHVN